MLSLPSSVKIFLAAEPADMRKGFDGLSRLVREALGNDPLSGHLFVFPLHPYVVFEFTKDRTRAGPIGPAEFLKGFEGYLQADAYSGYDGIYLDSRGTIHEVACWAHARTAESSGRESERFGDRRRGRRAHPPAL